MGGRVVRAVRASLAVVGVVLGVTLLLPGSPAAAHNSFTGSDPKDGAILAEAPQEVELRFLSSVSNRSEITVTGPDGTSAAAGEPTFDGKTVTVPVQPGPAGEYTVAFSVPSADGHRVRGEVTFTVTTGVTPEASPSAEPSVEPSPSAEPAASPVPAADASDDGGSGWLWALGGVALVGALVAGLLLRRRAAR
ncbi:copper resistance CopC family protein [Micromonospora sp. NPDC000207]|uniref:copper resistance CopC family protein n=1 Tax=Micromonospora sp. NPDC000207 TaxID=3154246 RepID=UPI003324A76A